MVGTSYFAGNATFSIFCYVTSCASALPQRIKKQSDHLKNIFYPAKYRWFGNFWGSMKIK